jgi:hypothetical protein
MTRNRKKRSAAAAAAQTSPSETSLDEKIDHSNAFLDLTDKENPDFRVSSRGHFHRSMEANIL